MDDLNFIYDIAAAQGVDIVIIPAIERSHAFHKIVIITLSGKTEDLYIGKGKINNLQVVSNYILTHIKKLKAVTDE